MNIHGPRSISAVNALHPQEVALRLFQRVTAQVLSVTGTTALLTVEGYPVVAQLATAEQATTLLSRQTAHFIVTERTNQKVTLKIIENDQTLTSLGGLTFHGAELAVRLLEQHNMPITVNKLVIARALLKKHLPVDSTLIAELQETLSSYGIWGSKEADLAVSLKAAGLPVSPQSLALASRQVAQIGDSLTRLIAKLTNMAEQGLPEELLEQLRSNLQMLNHLVLKTDGQASQLAEQMKTAVEILGQSLENILLDQSQNPKADSIEKNLLSLAQLQQTLEQAGQNEFAREIDEFIRDLRLNQFLNAKPAPIPSQSEWAEIALAIQNPQQLNEGFTSARLRIARESGNGSGKINPAYTRLILQVDLKPGQTVEVDLSLVNKQIKSSVTTPDALWCQKAQEELPSLEQALQALGFTLNETRFETGEPQALERLTVSDSIPLMRVDIEV